MGFGPNNGKIGSGARPGLCIRVAPTQSHQGAGAYMFKSEAEWHARQLSQFEPRDISPLLNIGSSDKDFREVEQPWLQEVIFGPQEQRGVRIIHCDIRDGDGIDLKADILTAAGFEAAIEAGVKALLCTNVLEHVEDPQDFADRCKAIVGENGLLFVTVPNSYPRHRDPIDTMFRPDPDEIAALFPDCDVISADIIPTGYYWQQLRKRPLIIFRQIFRLPFPFLGWEKWKRSMKRFYWLVRPYRQSCVILRKKSS